MMPSPLIPPMVLLVAASALSIIALAAWRIVEGRRRRELAALARSWQMHYSREDVFRLAARMAPHLPIPGAADVRVRDLIYCSESGQHRYIFCAEFTVGAIRSKARRHCVVCCREPDNQGIVWSSLKIAPTDLPLVEQYRTLKEESRSSLSPSPAAGATRGEG
jgi:hypothetical protein